MAGIDPFASITAATLDLLTRDGDLFLTLGTNLFRGLAVILIAWFGIRAALTSAEGGPPRLLGPFASLLLTIAFGFTMMTYYRAPIPGLGLSFTQLLTDQPIFLARQLEVTQVQHLSDRLNQLYLAMEQPSVFNVMAIVGYFLVALAVTFARVVLLAVIAFGLVATGVAVLVDPPSSLCSGPSSSTFSTRSRRRTPWTGCWSAGSISSSCSSHSSMACSKCRP